MTRHAKKYSHTHTFCQRPIVKEGAFDSFVNKPQNLWMADLQSHLRGFVVSEAKKRRSTWMVNGRPNASRIATDVGISQPTVSRLLTGTRHTIRAGNRRSTVRLFTLSAEMESALMAYFRFSSVSDLLEAIENSPSVGPLHTIKRR